mmetsp:Transcript_1694/g.6766  ORF Transcript_1694/g.6766 Transcript_1694/m.6766 type:complete len:337 (+) Transcript_1694:8003-9013(+)
MGQPNCTEALVFVQTAADHALGTSHTAIRPSACRTLAFAVRFASPSCALDTADPFTGTSATAPTAEDGAPAPQNADSGAKASMLAQPFPIGTRIAPLEMEASSKPSAKSTAASSASKALDRSTVSIIAHPFGLDGEFASFSSSLQLAGRRSEKPDSMQARMLTAAPAGAAGTGASAASGPTTVIGSATRVVAPRKNCSVLSAPGTLTDPAVSAPSSNHRNACSVPRDREAAGMSVASPVAVDTDQRAGTPKNLLPGPSHPPTVLLRVAPACFSSALARPETMGQPSPPNAPRRPAKAWKAPASEPAENSAPGGTNAGSGPQAEPLLVEFGRALSEV